MIVGMDFGTTNTGAAVYDGNTIRLLPIDPLSPTPHTCRSTIYITRERDYYLGSTALSTYFTQNVGRPTRYVKIRVGEIKQVFAELPTFYRDVFVYEDEFAPGRFFTSIKTALRNQNFYGTVYQNTWYSASDLVAIFLSGMKLRIERSLQTAVDEIVLGRPVFFSTKPDEDKVAQSRLLAAAFKAGFKRVYLEYEPVAAALAYEKTLTKPEVVLIFDFGGGTLDFTVMKLGDSGDRQVLATGGIPIAGDVFDQRLFRVSIPKHLGENDYFVNRGVRYPIPAHIFDLLSTPNEILTLNTPQNLEMLRSIHQGAVHKEKTQALIQIISSNYALLLFDQIEQNKRKLSSQSHARLSFRAENIALEENISRESFEHAIRHDYAAISAELENTLSKAGLKNTDIDRVIRTGGSSQIPLFVRMLNQLFGGQKVHAIDIFSSVTSGLAIRSHEIARGVIDLPAYTPDMVQNQEQIVSGPHGETDLNEVNLENVVQRLEVAQEFSTQQDLLPRQVLITVQEGVLELHAAQELPTVQPESGQILQKAQGNLAGQVRYAHIDEHLLCATNLFKFISLPVRSLYQSQQIGPQAVLDRLPLEPGERVTAILNWHPEKIAQGWLTMVTQWGQMRSFDAHLLAEQVIKKPYFQSEHKYTGVPVCLVYASQDDWLMIGTNSGKFACAQCKDTGVGASEIIKLRTNEKVTAAAAYTPSQPAFAINAQGAILNLPAPFVRTLEQTSGKGATLRRNFHVQGLAFSHLPGPRRHFLLTSRGRLYPLSLTVDPDESGTIPRRLLPLLPDETVIAVWDQPPGED